ncbi:MAG: hypothetical protein ACT4O0_14625 [Pseudonocardia sp.]
MTRYVLADVRQAADELSRRAAELTDWLDRVAAEHRPPSGEDAGDAELGLADLACVQAVSAAALRLAAAGRSVAACAGDLHGVDSELARRWCR